MKQMTGIWGKRRCISSVQKKILFKAMIKKIKQEIRCRQETINKRFKHFEVLKTTFRHDISLHADIFRAVAVLVQLQIEEGEKLFDVDQYDDTNFE